MSLESIHKALSEMEEREKAATPGPWFNGQAQDGEVLPDGSGYAGDYYETDEVMARPADIEDEPPFLGQIQGDADRAFVIHSRQDLPKVRRALLVAVERLHKVSQLSVLYGPGSQEALAEISSILSETPQ